MIWECYGNFGIWHEKSQKNEIFNDENLFARTVKLGTSISDNGMYRRGNTDDSADDRIKFGCLVEKPFKNMSQWVRSMNPFGRDKILEKAFSSVKIQRVKMLKLMKQFSDISLKQQKG